jgi:hypothetical protein
MGALEKLQRSYALSLLPSQFVAWIDAVSAAIDGFIPSAVPPAGEVPTSTGTAWETIGLRQGLDLSNSNVVFGVIGGNVYFLRAATLSAARQATLGTAGAVVNDVIGIVREDVTAFTYTVINGGPAAGTLYVFAGDGVKRVAWFQFDGVDWYELSQAVITSSI